MWVCVLSRLVQIAEREAAATHAHMRAMRQRLLKRLQAGLTAGVRREPVHVSMGYFKSQTVEAVCHSHMCFTLAVSTLLPGLSVQVYMKYVVHRNKRMPLY